MMISAIDWIADDTNKNSSLIPPAFGAQAKAAGTLKITKVLGGITIWENFGGFFLYEGYRFAAPFYHQDANTARSPSFSW